MSEETVVATESFTDLQSLLAWLWSRQEKIRGVADEIEQMQRAFTTRLVDMQQRLDDSLVSFVAALE